MCTGAPEIRFSHSMCDAVRESNPPRGNTSLSVDTGARGPASSRFSHALTPIGERNEFADPEARHQRKEREADKRLALVRIIRAGMAGG